MENLVTYIFEAEVTAGGYKIDFQTKEECKSYFKEKYQDQYINNQQIIDELIDLLYNEYNNGISSVSPFVFDATKLQFKIRRDYLANDKLDDFLNQNNIKNKIGGIPFTYGNGSAGKKSNVDTDIQESISSMIFTKLFNKSQVNDNDIIEVLKNTKYEKFSQQKAWLNTWVAQFNALKQGLVGWGNNCICARCEKTTDDKIVKLLNELHNVVSSLLKQINDGASIAKDGFDPSDVIVYDKSKEAEIISIFKNLIQSPNIDPQAKFMNIKTTLLNLCKDKLYIGVSLKKCADCKPVFLNFDDENKAFENFNLNPIDFDIKKKFLGSLYNQYKDKLNELDDKFYFSKIKSATKRSKSLIVFCNTTDRGEIKINYRTNHDSIKDSLILEPALSGKSAQIGKVPKYKYVKLLTKKNKDFSKIANNPAQYNTYDDKMIDEICLMWDELLKQNKYINTGDTTTEDIKNIFLLANKIDRRKTKNEFYSYYCQINFLYALFQYPTNINKDDIINLNNPSVNDILRIFLLSAEKIGDDCLPYLLLEPTK